MTEINISTDIQKIPTGLVSFENRKKDFIELVESSKDLTIKDLNDKEGYAKVRAKRIEIRTEYEIPVEKEAKALRDILTPVGRHISKKENELLDITSKEMIRLTTLEGWYLQENEKIKIEKEAEEKAKIQKRIDELASYGVAVDYVLVLGMTDQQFEERLNQSRIEFEAEQQRLANEKALEEQVKKDEEERLKRIALEQAEKQAELDRVAKEQKEVQDKIDAQLKAIQEAKDHAEREKQEAENARIKEQERIEKEKRDAELLEQLRKDVEAETLRKEEERRIKEEQDRKAAEILAAEKARKKEMRKPDTEKLIIFSKIIEDLEKPELKSEEAKKILNDVLDQLNSISAYIRKEVESL